MGAEDELSLVFRRMDRLVELQSRREVLERIAMGAEDVRVAAGAIDVHLEVVQAKWDAQERQEELESLVAMESVRLAAAQLSVRSVFCFFSPSPGCACML